MQNYIFRINKACSWKCWVRSYCAIMKPGNQVQGLVFPSLSGFLIKQTKKAKAFICRILRRYDCSQANIKFSNKEYWILASQNKDFFSSNIVVIYLFNSLAKSCRLFQMRNNIFELLYQKWSLIQKVTEWCKSACFSEIENL